MNSEGQPHILRDNFGEKKGLWSIATNPRALLGFAMALTMTVSGVRQKVSDILDPSKAPPQSSSQAMSDILDLSNNTPPQNSPQAIKVKPNTYLYDAEVNALWKHLDGQQCFLNYRIRPGDTLSGIARRLDTEIAQILRYNTHIASADSIEVGHFLIIPVQSRQTHERESTPDRGSHVDQLTLTPDFLKQVIKNVLTDPRGPLRKEQGDIAPDKDRLRAIAQDMGMIRKGTNVEYVNYCAANIRAFSASLEVELQNQGYRVDLGWDQVGSGSGVGAYYADRAQRGTLPEGYKVITTKDNPDTLKLQKLLLEQSEYSIFILSYSHAPHGHVNMAFRIGEKLYIFDPSWKGGSDLGERIHHFDAYMNYFVRGENNAYGAGKNRYNLINVTCVPATRTSSDTREIRETLAEDTSSDGILDGKETRIFEGFSAYMQKDKINNTTYFIGYGTDVGTLQDSYPYASYGKDVAHHLEKRGFDRGDIRNIINGKKSITKALGEELFEMRYIQRYRQLQKFCGSEWNAYPPLIQAFLVDLTYNLKGEYGIFPSGEGKYRRAGFPDAVNALKRGDWAGFANEMADSHYATRDVGPRRAGYWISEIVTHLVTEPDKLSQKVREIMKKYDSRHRSEITGSLAQRS